MYSAHFGLKQPPFKITPNTAFFFTGGNRGAVLDALVYAISSGEGIIKVVGEVGSGKTMLCRMLQTLLPQSIESVYLANPSVAPEAVLHAIAFELHLDLPEKADRLQVMHALHQHLLKRHEENRQVVIFVEEAQGMPIATLEEIRLLTNLETNVDKLLQIVLFGQPELEKNLLQPEIRQLRERITQSFNLGPLASNEIGEYLIFRLRTAGYFGPHLFTPQAIRKIAQASQGLVRRVNILADKALLAAYAEGSYSITPKHIRIALKDSAFSDTANTKISYKQPLWLGITLLLGLAVGAALSWLPHTNQAQSPALAKLQPTAPQAVPMAIPEKSAPIPVKPSESIQSAEAITAAVVAPPTPTDPLEQKLISTTNWLNSQASNTVSIQLMSIQDSEQVKKQLNTLGAQVESDQLFVFKTKVAKLDSYTLLYGNFANRADASLALSHLPKALLANHPQLRTVGGVNEEIKKFQSLNVAN